MSEERVIPGISSPELMAEHIGRYEFALDYIKGMKVLDVACGSGYGSHLLAQYAYDVKAVDISQEAVDYAQAHYHDFNLEFICGDACKLPFEDNTFDTVVSFETIEHIKDYEGFLKEVKRVLKPHGVFICSTPNSLVGGGIANNPYHVVEFTPAEFATELRKEFSFIEIFGQKDIDQVKNTLSKMIVSIKKKVGIERQLVPSKKASCPVTYFKDGFCKSVYMVAVCYLGDG